MPAFESKNPTIERYEAFKNSSNFNEGAWEYANQNNLQSVYLDALALADASGIKYQDYSRELGLDYVGGDMKFQALMAQVGADRKTINQHTEFVYDQNGNRIEDANDPSGFKTRTVNATDYQYTLDKIKQFADYKRIEYDNTFRQEVKDSMNGFGKFVKSAYSLAGHGVLRGTTVATDVGENFYAFEQAIENSMRKGTNFFDEWVEAFDSTDEWFYNQWMENLEKFQAEYTYLNKLDGSYQNWFTQAIQNVVDEANRIAARIGIAYLTAGAGEALGLSSAAIAGAKTAVSASMSVGSIFKGNVKEASQKFGYLGEDSKHIILDAAIKAGVEEAIEIVPEMIFGGTSVSKMVYGIGESSRIPKSGSGIDAVIKGVFTDAVKEGSQEVAQDISNILIDDLYGEVTDSNIGELSEFSVSDTLMSFVVAAILSGVGTGIDIATIERITITDDIRLEEVRLNKLQSWMFKNDYASFKQEVDAFTKEMKKGIHNKARTDAVYTKMMKLAIVYNQLGDKRFGKIIDTLDSLHQLYDQNTDIAITQYGQIVEIGSSLAGEKAARLDELIASTSDMIVDTIVKKHVYDSKSIDKVNLKAKVKKKLEDIVNDSDNVEVNINTDPNAENVDPASRALLNAGADVVVKTTRKKGAKKIGLQFFATPKDKNEPKIVYINTPVGKNVSPYIAAETYADNAIMANIVDGAEKLYTGSWFDMITAYNDFFAGGKDTGVDHETAVAEFVNNDTFRQYLFQTQNMSFVKFATSIMDNLGEYINEPYNNLDKLLQARIERVINDICASVYDRLQYNPGVDLTWISDHFPDVEDNAIATFNKFYELNFKIGLVCNNHKTPPYEWYDNFYNLALRINSSRPLPRKFSKEEFLKTNPSNITDSVAVIREVLRLANANSKCIVEPFTGANIKFNQFMYTRYGLTRDRWYKLDRETALDYCEQFMAYENEGEFEEDNDRFHVKVRLDEDLNAFVYDNSKTTTALDNSDFENKYALCVRSGSTDEFLSLIGDRESHYGLDINDYIYNPSMLKKFNVEKYSKNRNVESIVFALNNIAYKTSTNANLKYTFQIISRVDGRFAIVKIKRAKCVHVDVDKFEMFKKEYVDPGHGRIKPSRYVVGDILYENELPEVIKQIPLFYTNPYNELTNGEFWPETGAVALRQYVDVDTLYHEINHAMEFYFRMTNGAIDVKFKRRLSKEVGIPFEELSDYIYSNDANEIFANAEIARSLNKSYDTSFIRFIDGNLIWHDNRIFVVQNNFKGPNASIKYPELFKLPLQFFADANKDLTIADQIKETNRGFLRTSLDLIPRTAFNSSIEDVTKVIDNLKLFKLIPIEDLERVLVGSEKNDLTSIKSYIGLRNKFEKDGDETTFIEGIKNLYINGFTAALEIQKSLFENNNADKAIIAYVTLQNRKDNVVLAKPITSLDEDTTEDIVNYILDQQKYFNDRKLVGDHFFTLHVQYVDKSRLLAFTNDGRVLVGTKDMQDYDVKQKINFDRYGNIVDIEHSMMGVEHLIKSKETNYNATLIDEESFNEIEKRVEEAKKEAETKAAEKKAKREEAARIKKLAKDAKELNKRSNLPSVVDVSNINTDEIKTDEDLVKYLASVVDYNNFSKWLANHFNSLKTSGSGLIKVMYTDDAERKSLTKLWNNIAKGMEQLRVKEDAKVSGQVTADLDHFIKLTRDNETRFRTMIATTLIRSFGIYHNSDDVNAWIKNADKIYLPVVFYQTLKVDIPYVDANIVLNKESIQTHEAFKKQLTSNRRDGVIAYGVVKLSDVKMVNDVNGLPSVIVKPNDVKTTIAAVVGHKGESITRVNFISNLKVSDTGDVKFEEAKKKKTKYRTNVGALKDVIDIQTIAKPEFTITSNETVTSETDKEIEKINKRYEERIKNAENNVKQNSVTVDNEFLDFVEQNNNMNYIVAEATSTKEVDLTNSLMEQMNDDMSTIDLSKYALSIDDSGLYSYQQIQNAIYRIEARQSAGYDSTVSYMYDEKEDARVLNILNSVKDTYEQVLKELFNYDTKLRQQNERLDGYKAELTQLKSDRREEISKLRISEQSEMYDARDFNNAVFDPKLSSEERNETFKQLLKLHDEGKYVIKSDDRNVSKIPVIIAHDKDLSGYYQFKMMLKGKEFEIYSQMDEDKEKFHSIGFVNVSDIVAFDKSEGIVIAKSSKAKLKKYEIVHSTKKLRVFNGDSPKMEPEIEDIFEYVKTTEGEQKRKIVSKNARNIKLVETPKVEANPETPEIIKMATQQFDNKPGKRNENAKTKAKNEISVQEVVDEDDRIQELWNKVYGDPRSKLMKIPKIITLKKEDLARPSFKYFPKRVRREIYLIVKASEEKPLKPVFQNLIWNNDPHDAGKLTLLKIDKIFSRLESIDRHTFEVLNNCYYKNRYFRTVEDFNKVFELCETVYAFFSTIRSRDLTIVEAQAIASANTNEEVNAAIASVLDRFTEHQTKMYTQASERFTSTYKGHQVKAELMKRYDGTINSIFEATVFGLTKSTKFNELSLEQPRGLGDDGRELTLGEMLGSEDEYIKQLNGVEDEFNNDIDTSKMTKNALPYIEFDNIMSYAKLSTLFEKMAAIASIYEEIYAEAYAGQDVMAYFKDYQEQVAKLYDMSVEEIDKLFVTMLTRKFGVPQDQIDDVIANYKKNHSNSPKGYIIRIKRLEHEINAYMSQKVKAKFMTKAGDIMHDSKTGVFVDRNLIYDESGKPITDLNKLEEISVRLSNLLTRLKANAFVDGATSRVIDKLENTYYKSLDKQVKVNKTRRTNVTIKGHKFVFEKDDVMPPKWKQIVFNAYDLEAKLNDTNLTEAKAKLTCDQLSKQNAELLLNMTTEEASEILEYIVSNKLLSGDTMVYLRMCSWFLGVSQNEAYIEKWKLDADLRKRVSLYYDQLKSDTGSLMSTFAYNAEHSNLETLIVKALTEGRIGFEIDEVDAQEVADAIRDGDFSKVEEAAGRLTKKIKDKHKDLEISKFDIILHWEMVGLLSGPGTWVRNKLTNFEITTINMLADKFVEIFDKTLSKPSEGKKYSVQQLSLKGIKAEDEEIEKVYDAYDALFKMTSGGLGKYDSDKEVDVNAQLSAIVTKAITNDIISSKFNLGSKVLEVYGNFVGKMISDDKEINKYACELFVRICKAKGMDINADGFNFMSKEAIGVLAIAYRMAAREYLHNPNFASKLEKTFKTFLYNNYSAMVADHIWFVYKQIAPFVKTGTNIVIKALENGPIGLTKGIYDLYHIEQNIHKQQERKEKGKTYEDPEFEEYRAKTEIAKGAIGSLAWLVAFLLSVLGLKLFETDEKDDKVKLKVGDVYIDISDSFALQGVYLGMTMGKALRGDEINWVEAASSTFNIMFDDFAVMGILDDIRYSSSNLDYVTGVMSNSVSMMVPAFIRTFASVVNMRQTVYDKNILEGVERFLVQNVPFASYAFPAYVDVYTGETQSKYRAQLLVNAFNKSSPIKIMPYNMSDLEKVAYDLGVKKGMLNGRYTVNGEKVNLGSRKIMRLNQIYGSLNQQSLTALMNDEVAYRVAMENGKQRRLYWSEMSDAQKKTVIERITSDNSLIAKEYMLTEYYDYQYYATNEEYEKLTSLGASNVFRKTLSMNGFVK